MARDDLFRRSFEAGTAFLDMTRERAEALVKELVKAGDVRKGKAQKLIDELLERSRKGTEELRQIVRREIADQVGALGLATKDDIGRLESRLDTMAASATRPGGPPAPGLADPPAPTGGPLAAADPRPSPSPQPSKAPPVKRGGSRKAAAPRPETPKMAKAPPTRKASRSSTPAAAEPPLGIGDGDAGGPPPEG